MSTHPFVAQANKLLNLGVAMPAMQLAETAEAAEIAMDNAIAFCAYKANASGPEAVLSLLRMGDPTILGYWRYGLAQQVAGYVGDLDGDVRSVYVGEYDATPEDIVFGETRPNSLIHMIVWVSRKTAALTALVEALDLALVAECGRQLDRDEAAHLLDVQVVDDDEVREGVGYGALLSSSHHRPIRVWQRPA
jgi:hypothetical protein